MCFNIKKSKTSKRCTKKSVCEEVRSEMMRLRELLLSDYKRHYNHFYEDLSWEAIEQFADYLNGILDAIEKEK